MNGPIIELIVVLVIVGAAVGFGTRSVYQIIVGKNKSNCYGCRGCSRADTFKNER